MNVKDAQKVLGVTESSTSDEIKSQYRKLARQWHPDKNPDSDGREFVTINAAYMVLKAKGLGITEVKGVPVEVAEAIDIKAAIKDYFNDVEKDFIALRSSIENTVKRRIKNSIMSSKTKGDLRSALNGSVKTELIELKATVESFIKQVERNSSSNKNDFIFGLFSEMYEQRRKYWLLNLWKNPVIVIESLGLFSLFLVNNSQFVGGATPLSGVLSSNSTPVIMLAVGAFALLVEYIRLSPNKQFVPPRISLESLHSMLTNKANGMGFTNGQAAVAGGVGGGVTGLILGSILLPGIGGIIGTAIGGILGGVFGSDFGRSVGEMKSEVCDEILKELDVAFEQIEEAMRAWTTRAREDIYEAVMESFTQNTLKIGKLLGTKKLPLLEFKRGA